MHPANFLRGTVATAVLALAATAASPAAAIDSSYSGSWYRPSESGSGFNLEIFSDERALLFWYTYNEAGEPIWLYSEGDIDGDTIDFVTYYSDGKTFSDPTLPRENRVWGNVLMEFTDCNTATISYDSTLTGVPNSPEGTREIPVERLVNIAGLPCRRQAAGYWKGEHYDPTLNGGLGGFADLSGVLTEDGRLYMSSEGSDEVFLGTYSIVGESLVFDYRICPNGSGDCVDATGTSQYASLDFAHGTGTSPWGVNPFNLHYSTIYDRSVTLASLAGTWELADQGIQYTVTISAEGLVSGNDTLGCVYSGQLAPVDAKFNAFEFAGSISACTAEGWTGLVINTDDDEAGDRDALEFRVDGADGGGYAFTLVRSE